MQRNARGCGLRVKGGTYLFCEANCLIPCQSLPLALPDRCPVCGEELEQFRGIKIVNPQRYFKQKQEVIQKCPPPCPACYPPERGAIMWVGKKYYSAKSFIAEAIAMGISKRIVKKPKDLLVGDILYLVHPEAFPPEEGNVRGKPGVFLVSRISAFHRIIDEKQGQDEAFVKSLEEQGLTPVIEYDAEPVNTTTCNDGTL